MAVLAWLAGAAATGATAQDCGGEAPCAVEGGAYHVVAPPGWDGRTRLPATIFFHGWRSSAAAFLADEPFKAAFAAEGVLLVLPDGLNGTWAHQGSPSRARDEIAFMDAVRADLLARWPVDPDRLLVTGFSQGGSMAWDLACQRGRDYAAFAPIAGAFWEPLPESCAGGPVRLLHIHGLDDPVVPMEGRWIRNTWKQGDVHESLARLEAANGCPAGPTGQEAMGELACEVWSACGSGRELRLCLHPSGHLMPEGWVPLVHAWMRGLSDDAVSE